MGIAALVLVVALGSLSWLHPVEFWREIAKNHYEPPAGSDIEALARELSDLLGSPDPELRDEIAYSTLATWIYQTRVLRPEALRGLTDRWVAHLTDHIGETGNDFVLRRSFSALLLSVIVARDNAEPFLTSEEFDRIETAALDYLDSERDLRGYDPQKGWMHSTAHTADLLKFTARSRFLDAAGQRRILDAIARKSERASIVFTYGEDERLARAVLSVVNRGDFDRAGFNSWTERMRPVRPPERPSAAELTSFQNRKNLLAKLEVVLSEDAQPSASVQSARDAVRAALKDLF